LNSELLLISQILPTPEAAMTKRNVALSFATMTVLIGATLVSQPAMAVTASSSQPSTAAAQSCNEILVRSIRFLEAVGLPAPLWDVYTVRTQLIRASKALAGTALAAEAVSLGREIDLGCF
jgi:hypothetical protein